MNERMNDLPSPKTVPELLALRSAESNDDPSSLLLSSNEGDLV